MAENKVKIFYSYSHKDEVLRDELETSLAILKRQGLIETWHDRKIIPGKKWDREIDSNIHKADVILLMVSPDFIASDYCYGKELNSALQRHDVGRSRVIPLIIRPADWHEAPFAGLQALPRDGVPVTTWENRDLAWLDVVKGIRRAIEEILADRESLSVTPESLAFGALLTHEFERIYSRLEKKARTSGFPTGFHDLDTVIDGLHNNDIIVVAGRPSTGKTDFVSNISFYLASQKALPVAFFSMKYTPQKWMDRVISSETQISLSRILRATPKIHDVPKLARMRDIFDKIPILFQSGVSFTDIEILERATQIKKTNGLGLLVIDGLEHVTRDNRGPKPKDDITGILKNLKIISRTLDVPLLITVTTAREADLREDKRPRIKDLDEWETLATEVSDIVILLYRHDVYCSSPNELSGIVEAIVAKNPYGQSDTVRLAYMHQYCAFRNLYIEK
ncbi:MAG TPA: DnaB-like helicase C-terminal domain-containing protein [Syntrophorhabdaceae bacterium]|jgi:replicative DNA helicase